MPKPLLILDQPAPGCALHIHDGGLGGLRGLQALWRGAAGSVGRRAPDDLPEALAHTRLLQTAGGGARLHLHHGVAAGHLGAAVPVTKGLVIAADVGVALENTSLFPLFGPLPIPG